MNRARSGAAAAAAVAAALLAACATPTDRVTLLPGADGRSSGAVSVTAAKGQLLLSEPYAQGVVAGGQVEPARSNAQQVQATYGAMLALQPPRARTWTVYFFEQGSNTLTRESMDSIASLRAALADYTAGEIVVTGHTDRVGSVASNDRLSLARAATVRDLLVAAGVAPERILVGGRGEREPLVPTPDETPEPGNRRVEIRLR